MQSLIVFFKATGCQLISLFTKCNLFQIYRVRLLGMPGTGPRKISLIFKAQSGNSHLFVKPNVDCYAPQCSTALTAAAVTWQWGYLNSLNAQLCVDNPTCAQLPPLKACHSSVIANIVQLLSLSWHSCPLSQKVMSTVSSRLFRKIKTCLPNNKMCFSNEFFAANKLSTAGQRLYKHFAFNEQEHI